MAERNVEIVRQVYECVNQRRWDRMAELLDLNVAPYGTVGGVEEGSVVRRSSEITQMYESEADAWAGSGSSQRGSSTLGAGWSSTNASTSAAGAAA